MQMRREFQSARNALKTSEGIKFGIIPRRMKAESFDRISSTFLYIALACTLIRNIISITIKNVAKTTSTDKNTYHHVHQYKSFNSLYDVIQQSFAEMVP